MSEEQKPWWEQIYLDEASHYAERPGKPWDVYICPALKKIVSEATSRAEQKERQRVLQILNKKFTFDSADERIQFLSELIDEIV